MNSRRFRQSLRLIAGLHHHPNVAGATVLSLDCQHAQIAILRQQIAKCNPHFVKPLFILSSSKAARNSRCFLRRSRRLSRAGRSQQVRAYAGAALFSCVWV